MTQTLLSGYESVETQNGVSASGAVITWGCTLDGVWHRVTRSVPIDNYECCVPLCGCPPFVADVEDVTDLPEELDPRDVGDDEDLICEHCQHE